jgi:hypothetical protein
MKKLVFVGLPVFVGLVVLYFLVVLNWNYSSGERAGWVQKFSKKGWVCKTWEGELAMVSMPGTAQEKFFFTVWDDDVARRINEAMGRRVSLHYAEKVGLPSTCFGETLYWVDNITIVPEIPLAPGIVVPTPQPQPAQPAVPLPGQQPAQPAQPPAAPSQSAPPVQPTPAPTAPSPTTPAPATPAPTK